MIDWSWELLTGPEQTVLRRLAVHADGCTLEAAEAVCAGDGVPPDDVLDLLARLVDRSLVVVAGSADGPRYRLLESVAAYCLDRLRRGRRGRRAYAAGTAHHYTELAERAEPFLHGREQRRWLRRLDAEAANLRAALRTARYRDGAADRALRLVDALAWYWFLRGRLGEARRSLAAACGPRRPDDPPRARRAGVAGVRCGPSPRLAGGLPSLGGRRRRPAERARRPRTALPRTSTEPRRRGQGPVVPRLRPVGCAADRLASAELIGPGARPASAPSATDGAWPRH